MRIRILVFQSATEYVGRTRVGGAVYDLGFRNRGRERPHETFWAAESRKSGVAPARFGSFNSAAL
jgi:hypothetical protein